MPPPVQCRLWPTLSAEEQTLLNGEAAKAGYTDTIQWMVDKWCSPGTEAIMKRLTIDTVAHCVHLIERCPVATLLHVEKDLTGT